MAFNARSLRDNSADPSLLFRKSKGKSKSESERGGITEVKRRSLRMAWFGSGRRTPFEADVSCESAHSRPSIRPVGFTFTADFHVAANICNGGRGPRPRSPRRIGGVASMNRETSFEQIRRFSLTIAILVIYELKFYSNAYVRVLLRFFFFLRDFLRVI